MLTRVAEWLGYKWRTHDPQLLEAYRATFSSQQGRRVLQHLLDSTYCVVYEGTDPLAAVAHNARRSVVHEILMNIDAAEHPQKYIAEVERQNGVV